MRVPILARNSSRLSVLASTLRTKVYSLYVRLNPSLRNFELILNLII